MTTEQQGLPNGRAKHLAKGQRSELWGMFQIHWQINFFTDTLLTTDWCFHLIQCRSVTWHNLPWCKGLTSLLLRQKRSRRRLVKPLFVSVLLLFSLILDLKVKSSCREERKWSLIHWKLLGGYLKKGHVGAIIAVAFVVVRVVDKGTVFLWDAITCGNTSQSVTFVFLH